MPLASTVATSTPRPCLESSGRSPATWMAVCCMGPACRYGGPVATPEQQLDPQSLAERCAEAMLTADQASAWLGIRLLSVGPGRAELAMTVTEQMLNGHRI